MTEHDSEPDLGLCDPQSFRISALKFEGSACRLLKARLCLLLFQTTGLVGLAVAQNPHEVMTDRTLHSWFQETFGPFQHFCTVLCLEKVL